MPVMFNKSKKSAPAPTTPPAQEQAQSGKPMSLKEKFALKAKGQQAPPVETEAEEAPAPTTQQSTPSAKPAFIKTGAAAQAAVKKQEKQIEESKNQLWRFYIGVGEEKVVTFLDGYLGDGGVLNPPMWWEHQSYRNGHWRNWDICTQDEEPCPLCELPKNFASLVAGFTVIDHSEYKGKQGVIKNRLKLFVVKQNTMKILQKKATHLGQLAGCTFEVSRLTDNSPNCGDMFEFMEQNTLEDLKAEFETKDNPIYPVDFNEVLIYRTAQEMRELYGLGGGPIGAESNQYSQHM